MVKPIQLVLTLHLKMERLKLVLELAEGVEPGRVVGHDRGTLEGLAQDLVAGPDALRVEDGAEDLAPSLEGVSEALDVLSESSIVYPHQIQQPRAWDRHLVAIYMEWPSKHRVDSRDSAMLTFRRSLDALGAPNQRGLRGVGLSALQLMGLCDKGPQRGICGVKSWVFEPLFLFVAVDFCLSCQSHLP